MSKKVKEKLNSYKLTYGLLHKKECTAEETKRYKRIVNEKGILPSNVFPYYDYEHEGEVTGFYRIVPADLTEEEISEYLKFKKLDMIQTIKNCVLFFTIMTVISIVASIIFFLSVGSAFNSLF